MFETVKKNTSRLTRLASPQLGIVLNIIDPNPPISAPVIASRQTEKAPHMRLAACSILTTFAMTLSLLAGTSSQMLNASMSLPRISFPGFDVMNWNGSRIAYLPS
jgi:uncharacterized membrane protein